MSREIKFRAWYKDCKEMDYNPHADYDYYYNEPISVPLNDNFKDKDTIYMQYTGLHDKNGKEIYEGDVVKYCEDYMDEEDIEFGVVKYGEFNCNCCEGVYGFYVKQIKGKPCADIRQCYYNGEDSNIEVIGNIYENPELLESDG